MRNSFRISFVAAIVASLSVSAAGAEKIGEVATSGLMFKDSIEIDAFDDPTIKGISCYVTLAKRSMSLSDPTDSSLDCRKIGPVSGKIGAQSDIFSSNKNFFFKVTRVDRFYDAERNVLVYLSYTTSTGSNNHAHSVSVVPLGGQ